MFKAYQIKWYFILSAILILGSLLLRQDSISEAKLWQFADYLFRTCFLLLTCWLINAYFILHDFPSIKGITKLLIGVSLSILASIVLAFIFYLVMPQNYLNGTVVGFSSWKGMRSHFGSGFFISMFCYVVFYSAHTNTALQDSNLEKEILKQEHLRAQLISLQQQISPHFLFNSLSTLKTIATDAPTKNYILQLASVYRYVLNFNDEYLAPLKDELAFIKSYLYIMNERLEDALVVDIQVDEEYTKMFMPSLSLQLLIENAIKHNTISPEQPLRISIKTNGLPALVIENNYQPKKIPVEGTGLGLKNITERYRLLVNRTVEVTRNEGVFSVTIPLLNK